MKQRMFSVPYNGTSIKEYLQMLKKHENNIENIFFGIPDIIDSHVDYKYINKQSNLDLTLIQYVSNIYEFMSITKNSKYKRIITLNQGTYDMDQYEIETFIIKKLSPIIKEYNLNGCIVTNYFMAQKLHEFFPNLELHTSCNCFQWNIRQMELWRQNCGISVFNPPREILRTPKILKEMYDYGFKLKCLLNEACLYGCPQTINHCMETNKFINNEYNCNRNDPSNVFKGNYVLPSWLEELDEYIDIYKIAGRTASNKLIDNALYYYTNGIDPEYIQEIIIGGNLNTTEKTFNIKIRSSDIPKQVLTCECKKCNTSCNICKNYFNKIKNKRVTN